MDLKYYQDKVVVVTGAGQESAGVWAYAAQEPKSLLQSSTTTWAWTGNFHKEQGGKALHVRTDVMIRTGSSELMKNSTRTFRNDPYLDQ